MKAALIIGVALLTAACGAEHVPTGSELQFNYAPAAGARHTYEPYAFGSRLSAYVNGEIREFYIGGELEPRDSLRHIATKNGIRYYIGASRDGVGVERLENYKEDLLTSNGTDPYGLEGSGFVPFPVAPRLYLDPDFLDPENRDILFVLFDSVHLLNDALPPEFQIVLADTRATDIAYLGEIVVRLESPASIASKCGSRAVACARGKERGGHMASSALYLPDDFDTSEFNYTRSVIVHELLHALGIWGHVDSIEFPDSIMGSAGEYIPNVGYILSKIDREVLQIMYMSQKTESYNDWGEWSDTAFHLMGRSEDGDVNFGVALFNGLPQPWVRGTMPDTELAENHSLYGTATWTGSLLGFSGPSPIAGDAALQVRLATLTDPDNEQSLRFQNIYFVNRFENKDMSATSERWFYARNIDYKVNVYGNMFLNVSDEGYEQGHVTGAFLGPEHEHMGGTVKRTDMVAAFGGSR